MLNSILFKSFPCECLFHSSFTDYDQFEVVVIHIPCLARVFNIEHILTFLSMPPSKLDALTTIENSSSIVALRNWWPSAIITKLPLLLHIMRRRWH
jgi:hypothetical protein